MMRDGLPAPVDTASSPTPEAETEGGEALLELVLAEHPPNAPPARIDGVVIGRLVAIGASGEPLVDFAESPSEPGMPARSMAAVGPSDVGREVALLFEGGDPARPVLIGLMYTPVPMAPQAAQNSGALGVPPAAAGHEAASEAGALRIREIEGDGERLVFEADKEIVLRCGKASITLTRAGKILIKGAYLLARSSGVNRIQGGSVQIN
jgi:hypothetical protein